MEQLAIQNGRALTLIPPSAVSRPPVNTGYRGAVMALAGLVEYWRVGEASRLLPVAAEVGDPGAYINTPNPGQASLIVDANTSVNLFNASQSTIQVIPAPAIPLGASARTVVAWAKSSQTIIDATLLSYGTAAARQAFGIKLTQAGNLQVWVFGDDHDFAAGVPFDGATHMWAATYDGVTTLRAYKDGAALGAPQSLGAALNTVLDSNGIRMGVDFFQNLNFLDGILDEPAVWSRALSPAEIGGLWAAGHL